MNPALLLITFSLLLAAPGLWLLLRRSSLSGITAASALLLLACASAYTGIRLWREAAAPIFVLNAPAGHFQVITPTQLPAALASSRGRPVLLEFYADWCPSCVAWNTKVFNRPEVQAAMAPLVLLQINATELTPEVQQLLDQHGLPGLPAMLVFDRQGNEHTELRLLGEMSAPEFLQWLETRLLPSI
jgi:thiol:disulfide interchange protein